MPHFEEADAYRHETNPDEWVRHNIEVAQRNKAPHALAVTIDPALAASLLSRNPANWNRRPSEKLIERWAGVMKSGNWALNGESIIVALTGELNDGQHRLQACIDAGVPFRSMICFGIERETRDTLDQGKRRSMRDILVMHGHSYVGHLGGAVTLCIGYYQKNLNILDHGTATPNQVLDFIEQNKAILDSENMIMGLRMYRVFKATPAVYGGIYFLLCRTNRIVATRFFESVIYGVQFERLSDPRLRLVERLREHGNHTARMNRSEMLAVTIKAWNLFCAGEDSGRLRWRVGGKPEEIPTIDSVPEERVPALLKRMEWK